MPINPNIALGVQPVQMADPLAQYGKLAAIQGAQQQNALTQYQLGAAQRAEAKDVARTNALAQAGTDDTAIANALLKTGDLKGYSDFMKSRAERESANLKLITDKLALLPEAYRRADTPEAYLEVHKSVHSDNVLGPWLKSIGATPEKGLATFQNAVSSGKFDELRMGSMQSVSQLLEGMKPLNVAASSSVFDPKTKTFMQAPAAPETKDPEIKRYEYAKGQGYKGSLFDFKREMAMAGRTPAQAPAPSITQIVDPSNPNQMITIDARRYQGGGVGSPGVIGVGGKEPGAAQRINKAEEGKTQLSDDLANLRGAFDRLNEMRAIPSTQRNAASNIIASTQSSGVGQMMGRATGTEAQVERDVISSAKQRLVTSIKNATGMSAQQLNSNMELQSMLRSLSDVSLGYEASMRIIDDIENAYVKGDGKLPKRGGAKPAAPAAAAPTSDVRSQADAILSGGK